MDVESKRGPYDLYEFGEFSLDVAERSLTRGSRRIHLAPKTYEVLAALVGRANRLVTKRELLEQVWPDVFVEEGILTVHVAQLRKVFDDSRRSARYIETVSRAGYRFVADVRQLGSTGKADARQPPPPAHASAAAPP